MNRIQFKNKNKNNILSNMKIKSYSTNLSPKTNTKNTKNTMFASIMFDFYKQKSKYPFSAMVVGGTIVLACGYSYYNNKLKNKKKL